MNRTGRRLTEPLKRIVLGMQPSDAVRKQFVDQRELDGIQIRWPAILWGRYAWSWVEPLYYGFRERVSVTVVDIPQTLKGDVVVEVCRGAHVIRVGINCADDPDRIHLGTAEAGLDLEFKMQYRNEGYGSRNIVPGGYIGNSMLMDWYARRPRRVRERNEFLWDVYGRFGANFAGEVRARAVRLLDEQRRFRFYGGLRKVSFPKFLGEISRARVCIDLPGNGPFCFRLVNYLAVGACVVSVPHATSMPVPLVDRRHIVYTKPDMSDLVELCERYVNDESARESVRRAGREYYRENLYWRSLADYYLRTILKALPQ